MAGRTSLRELVALISECDAFVTNDSGPMHIAYAARTPLVAIFGSTDPLLTGPPLEIDGKGSVVLTPDIPCSPCFERTCNRNDLRCMYEIASDEVYFGIKKVLAETPAIFFDRDGTLCKDVGYLSKLDDFQVFEDIDSVHLLAEKGFKLIGVTNQSGISRGLIEETFVKDINNRFMKQYGFLDFYYCPHHPDQHCPCRKPEPEMLLRARHEHGIDLKKSYVIGDKEEDMILSKMVGAKGILVQTGKGQESQHADFIAKDLKEAVNWILKKGKPSHHL
jgi:heptosyltransferase-2